MKGEKKNKKEKKLKKEIDMSFVYLCCIYEGKLSFYIILNFQLTKYVKCNFSKHKGKVKK